MGVLTTNRKRSDECLNFNHTLSSPNSLDFDCQADHHISKKHKISHMQLSPERSVSSRNAFSRISQYPAEYPRFRRVVHAPCSKPRFVRSASSFSESRRETDLVGEKQGPIDEMGNFLNRQYDKPKTSSASKQHLAKDTAPVIDVEALGSKDVVSEDSRIEEVEILDDEREGRSAVSDWRSHETNGNVFLQDIRAKLPGYNLRPSSSAVSDLTNLTQKVDVLGKMLESPSVSLGAEEMGVPPHKKLHESAERRNSTLSSIAFRIEFNETKWSTFISMRLRKKPAEDVLSDPFAPLTNEEKDEVSRAFSASNRQKVLVRHENSNIEITGEILRCLGPGGWLNDEVINLYLELLKEREKREPKKFLNCHFFNTFFYKKLVSGRGGYDFKAVRRWTTQRKIGYGLVECDKIFVPIHKEIHWCLAVINKKDEKFQYLDSLKGRDIQVLRVLARYFVDEVKDKCGKDINVSSWEYEYVDDLPKQENGFDCGMFMIKYADFYSRGLGLCFQQDHMPCFRLKTAKEILRLKAE